MDYPNKDKTMSGTTYFRCDNIADKITSDLFMELMYAIRPIDLQEELKRMIKDKNIEPRYVNISDT